MTATSTTGVLEKKCIFCKCPGCKDFTTGFQLPSNCETIQAQDNIKEAARQKRDTDFLREYGNIDFITKDVKYHRTCNRKYISRGTNARVKDSVDTYSRRRESAFLWLLSYIDPEVIHKDTSQKLMDINSTYLEFLKGKGFENPTSEPYNLLTKIKPHYDSKLHVNQESKKAGYFHINGKRCYE